MRKILSSFLLILLLVLTFIYPVSSEEAWINLYSDVDESSWFYESLCAAGYNGFLTFSDSFSPDTLITKGDLAFALYSFADFRGLCNKNTDISFSDLDKESALFTPAAWCVQNNILDCTGSAFEPDKTCTKEELCSAFVNFANALDLNFVNKTEPKQFIDSLDVSKKHRSAVMSCKMASIVNGCGNGYFYPKNEVSRSSFVSALYSLMKACPRDTEKEVVDITPNVYDKLYDGFAPVPSVGFIPFVRECEPVTESYFDDAVFVGDSISVKLQFYNKATKALGGAKFLCAESLSPINAIQEVSEESIHPSFQGKKVKPEDGILMSGADKVYIMLGMNGIGIDFDLSLKSTKTLIQNILSKSPNVIIMVQSVTPITYKSSRADDTLNSDLINLYNEKLKEMCSQNGWYYIDVESALKDSYGYLNPAFCSDEKGMGIHFNDKGAGMWVNYLKTHVPAGLN